MSDDLVARLKTRAADFRARHANNTADALVEAAARITELQAELAAARAELAGLKDLGDEDTYRNATLSELRSHLAIVPALIAREQAAKIARNGCLVPPDGGSPTEAEADMCDRIAEAILAGAAP